MSALEVRFSRQGAIQIYVYLYLTVTIQCVTQVELGGRLLGSAGCLSYRNVSGNETMPVSSTESHSWLYVIVIVGTTGIALIVIITAVVLRIFLRRQQHTEEKQKPIDPHKVNTILGRRFVVNCNVTPDIMAHCIMW